MGVGLSAALLLAVAFAGSSDLRALADLPRSRTEVATVAVVAPALVVARGEAEGLPLRLEAAGGAALDFQVSPAPGLTLDLFRVGWVPGDGSRPGGEPDPLGGGYFRNRSYVACRRRLFFGNERWRVRRKVRLRDYVSGAWDEATNCRDFRSAKIAALVEARIREQEALDATRYACPMEPSACADAKKRYGALADRVLHPHCLAVETPRRPWWKLW